ncbi:hypothetical protein GGR51DRAFT_569388 [Nemania sp. FL0031]|nr:hypothetical protein GGR51DRAFT_569388 [Nemania sp. FL0031]
MNPLALLVITIAAINFIAERLFPILPSAVKGFKLAINKPHPTAATQPSISNYHGPIPTNIASPISGSGDTCDWALIYDLGGETREPFKLIDQEGVKWLRSNAGPMDGFRQKLERTGRISKRLAKDAGTLRAVLDHIAVTPTRNACELVLDLQRQLANYTAAHYWGSDVKHAVTLIDSVLKKLSSERSELRERQQESKGMHENAEEALFYAFERGARVYCLGADCRWAERVVRARKLTESILDMLTKRLGGVKAQVIEDARKDRENWAYVVGQMKWMLPMYVVLVIAGRLLAKGFAFAGNEILEENPVRRPVDQGEPVGLNLEF